MKDTLRKYPRVAIAFAIGALSSLIVGASAQSVAPPPVDPVFQEAVDPVFQEAPAAPQTAAPQTRVDVDNGSGGAPEATVVAPSSAGVQVQVQQVPVAPGFAGAPQPAPTSVTVTQPPTQPLASDPTALQQLEQSINAQQPTTTTTNAPGDPTRPIVRNNPALMTPYTVPRSAEGIFEDSDLTLREISYLRAERDRLGAMTERESAFVSQINARRAVIDALEAPTEAQVKAQEKVEKAQEKAQAEEAARPLASAAVAAIAPPQPFVNSIYSYDNKAYAEIFIGANKVVATEGTVLITGDRVISITPQGVVVSNRKGRKTTLRVIGTAGTSM